MGGRKRYAISGAHNSQNNTPPPTHYFHFARAAELAWTVYLSEDVDRQLQLSGSIHFNLTGGQWIRLGRGFLHLGFGGQPTELDARDVGAVQVQKGSDDEATGYETRESARREKVCNHVRDSHRRILLALSHATLLRQRRGSVPAAAYR